MRHLYLILKDSLYIGGQRADGHDACGTVLALHTTDILGLRKEEENINYPRAIRRIVGLEPWPHEGLVLAEGALQSEDQTVACPPWISQEVTDDPRYFNANRLQHPDREWHMPA